MRRGAIRIVGLIGTAALAFVLAVAPGASRAAAQGEPLVGLCPFPISHEFPMVHAKSHGLPPPAPYEGFDTGQVLVRVTNLDTGRYVEVTANAAAFGLDDGTGIFRGQAVAFFDEQKGDVPAGVWVIDGVVRVTFDADFHVVTATGGVIRRDLCAELS
jgi:hypothetical protein